MLTEHNSTQPWA